MGLLPLGYDLTAPRYDALVGASYAAQIGRLLDLIPPLPGAAILDVGCGTGVALFEAIRRLGPPRLAVGIDASPEMVRRAQAKAAALGIPARFLAAPAERLPFPSASFDVVISNSALHWFADRAGAVAEMARVLRPGGHLLLVAAVQPCCAEWLALLDAVGRRVLGRPQPAVLHALPTPAEVAAHLAAAGLVVPHLDARLWREAAGDPVRFVHAISTAMPVWQVGLAPLELALMEQALIDAVRRLGPGWTVTWAAVEAVATRPAVAAPMAATFEPAFASAITGGAWPPGVAASLPVVATSLAVAAAAAAHATASPAWNAVTVWRSQPAETVAIWRPKLNEKAGRVTVTVG